MISNETGAYGQPTSLRISREGAVLVIAYDRPAQKNAWSVTCARETVEAIIAANADPEVGAIVLTGEGAVYCAGADLKAESEYDPDTGRRLTAASFTMGKGDRNWIDLLSRAKPVIAAINGSAVGIGATHTLAADIRIAASSASFTFPFLKLGAMPECGSTALLARLIGAGRATDILLRGGTISASQALAWGLVTEVCADVALRDRAIALAQELASLPDLQLRLTKQMITANSGEGDAAAIMQNENDAFVTFLKEVRREKPLG